MLTPGAAEPVTIWNSFAEPHTSTSQVAVSSPIFAVTVVLPAFLPVTTPFSTVAMLSSALLHSTISVVFSGLTVAVMVSVVSTST